MATQEHAPTVTPRFVLRKLLTPASVGQLSSMGYTQVVASCVHNEAGDPCDLELHENGRLHARISNLIQKSVDNVVVVPCSSREALYTVCVLAVHTLRQRGLFVFTYSCDQDVEVVYLSTLLPDVAIAA